MKSYGNLRYMRMLMLFGSSAMLLGSYLMVVYASNADASATVAIPSTTLLIDAVLFDGVSADDEESVRLINISNKLIDVSGYRIGDGGSSVAILPPGSVIDPGQAIWIAWQGDAFLAQFGFPPDFESTDTLVNTPETEGTWPRYTNSGDEVFLINADSELVDVVIYEGGDPFSAGSSHWTGSTIERYSMPMSGKNGQILFRKRDPLTGRPVADTNTASDWGQDAADPLLGRRVMYPGWDIDSLYRSAPVTENASITITVSPDNAYESIAALIDRAEKSIHIQTHTFQNVAVMDNLASAAQRGVDVKLLMDGSPSGGMKNDQRYNCDQLTAVGAECWFMIGNDSEKVSKRYAFLHAKFMIIDGTYAVIGSDNLSPNSWPADTKSNGTWGRRGISIITDAPSVVRHLETLFQTDLAPERYPDIRRYAPELDAPLVGYTPFQSEDYLTYTVRYESVATFNGTFPFELIQAPENSLNPTSGLIGLLAQAGVGDKVYVQQQYERTHWGETPAQDPNIRLEAYIDAARRGASLWVMLDDYFDDSRNDNSNAATCRYLQELVIREGLRIQCLRENPTGLGIHNKMVLAEIGGKGYVHVGSINGSEVSSKANRELAIQFQSDEAYAYLLDVFQRDWSYIAHMPLMYSDYIGPAKHMLISEILYDPIGLDDKEYIELANPTDAAIDLSGYSISDALLPSEFADLRRFPANTVISPKSSMVIAQQGLPFIEEYGVEPDFEILDTSPAVPNLLDDEAWGDTATFVQWGNTGDVVILRDPGYQIVDAFAYGNREIPGQTTCSLVEAGHSLRRNPYWRDTNSCLDDFENWPAPVPWLLAN